MTVVATFVACKKESSDDYFVIDIQNVLGETEGITTVNAFCQYQVSDKWKEDTLAKAKFNDNGFRMLLPNPPQSKYLAKISPADWVKISDQNAKTLSDIFFLAYNSSGEMGFFFLEGGDYNTFVDAWYIYADRDFTVSGKYEGSQYNIKVYYEYNCTFKRGWNIRYGVIYRYDDVSISLITTQKPADIPLSWKFYPFIHLKSQFQDPIFNHNLYVERK